MLDYIKTTGRESRGLLQGARCYPTETREADSHDTHDSLILAGTALPKRVDEQYLTIVGS